MESTGTLLFAAGIITVGLFVLGVLWAPVGALVCGLIARRRGLEVKPWICIAAVCSALSFVPWFYAVARVSGLRVPRFLTGVAYILVYSAWLAGPIALMVSATIYSFKAELSGNNNASYADAPVFFAGWIALMVANLWTWYISLRALLRARRDGTREFDGVYLRPWILMIVWTLGVPVLMVVGTAMSGG